MKPYPNIPSRVEPFHAYVFDKLDGSNIRVEYSPKQGFYKFGSRTQLLSPEDEMLGSAYRIFENHWSDILRSIIESEKLGSPTFFFEFHGLNSFGGDHVRNEYHELTLIDVWIEKKGMMAPEDFLDIFGGTNIPRFLGKHLWDEPFLRQVRANTLKGITEEGVVGKAGNYREHRMAKCKTADWIIKIHERYEDVSRFDF